MEREFIIVNQLGLHARAAATLAKVTTRFQCDVTIRKGQQSVDGKSILGMMTLAAAQGTTLIVICVGVDAEEALATIGACIADRFGEDR